MQQDSHAELITYLDFAMITEKGETAVGDFVVELFKTWGYVHRERVARTRVDLSLLICGENRYAKADVCIVDRSQNDILLLVQVDKRLEHGEPVNARAQLVAAAAAAFNEKNAQREVVGLPPVEETVSCFANLLTLFCEIVVLRSYPALSWWVRRPCSLKFPSPELCPLIFAMGPILQRKPA